MDGGTVASLIMSLAAIIGAVIVWRKYKPEQRALDGEAAIKYQQVASQAAAREIEFMTKIDALEKRVEELERSLDRAEKLASKLEDWTQRLTHQVQSLGAIPVQFEPITRPRSTE